MSDANSSIRGNRFKDLCGQKFGRLLVVEFAGRVKGPTQSRTTWHCVCECGNSKTVAGSNLSNGHISSCGCFRSEKISKMKTTHGKTQTDEYKTFAGMKRRCENPKSPGFARYGANGVQVKYSGFEEFIADVGERPSKSHSIDRIDNKRGYEPGNCRWATMQEQQRNRTNNVPLTVDGITMFVTDWGVHTGLGEWVIWQRIAHGWCPNCTVEVPVNGAWCKHKTKQV